MWAQHFRHVLKWHGLDHQAGQAQKRKDRRKSQALPNGPCPMPSGRLAHLKPTRRRGGLARAALSLIVGEGDRASEGHRARLGDRLRVLQQYRWTSSAPIHRHTGHTHPTRIHTCTHVLRSWTAQRPLGRLSATSPPRLGRFHNVNSVDLLKL